MSKVKMFCCAVLALTAVAASAAPWAANTSRRAPHTLIVVSNHKSPRLMAEIILGLSRQSYLIVTADGRFYHAMAKETVKVEADRLDVYINEYNARRLLILGDERYVSADVERMLRRIHLKRIPIIRIYGDDWLRIAEELDDLLNIGNLAREFANNSRSMALSDRPLRNSNEAPAAPAAAPAAPAAPADNDAAAQNGPVVDPEK